MRTVSNEEELLAAAADANRIVVRGKITLGRSLQLLPGQQLAGSAPDAVLVFAGDVDGVRLSRDNDVGGRRIQVDPDRPAPCTRSPSTSLSRLSRTPSTSPAKTSTASGALPASCWPGKSWSDRPRVILPRTTIRLASAAAASNSSSFETVLMGLSLRRFKHQFQFRLLMYNVS